MAARVQRARAPMAFTMLALVPTTAGSGRMVVSQGMGVTVVGLVVGLAAAFGLSRFMQALLFQVEANDALTFTSVAVVLLLVSLAATWIPAARAAGADPVRALRSGSGR